MKKVRIGMAAAAVLATVALCACAPQQAQEPKSAASDAGQPQQAALQISSVDAGAAIPEADKHYAFGTPCAACHGVEEPTGAPVDDSACVSCHAWDDLAESTAGLRDMENRMENPHDSHIGQVSCLLCHSNHADSAYYCLTCHPEPEYQGIAVP